MGHGHNVLSFIYISKRLIRILSISSSNSVYLRVYVLCGSLCELETHLTGVEYSLTGLSDWKLEAATPNGCLIEQVSGDGPEQKPMTNFRRVLSLERASCENVKDGKVTLGEGEGWSL